MTLTSITTVTALRPCITECSGIGSQGVASSPSAWIGREVSSIQVCGGKSLGRFEPGEVTEKKNALIAEIIAHFNF